MTFPLSSETDVFETAVALHQAGCIEEAKSLYQTILTEEPDALDVLYLLASIAYQEANLDLAQNYLSRVLDEEPDNSGALYLAGLVNFRLADYAAAALQLEKALSQEGNIPDADVLVTLGNAQQFLQRLEDAKSSYQQALQLNPEHSDGVFQMSICLNKLGDLNGAESLLRKYIGKMPSDPEAHFQLGNQLATQGRYHDAEQCYKQALVLRPNHTETLINLGKVRVGQGLFDDALEAFQQVLVLMPDNRAALINLAHVYAAQKRTDDAIAVMRQMVAAWPLDVEYHGNLGEILLRDYRLDEAASSFRAALGLDPDNLLAHHGLGEVLALLGLPTEASNCYQHSARLVQDKSTPLSNCLMNLHYQPLLKQEAIFQAHKDYAEQFEAPFRSSWSFQNRVFDTNRKLRIGFVSGDFRFHPVGAFFLNVLKNIDQQVLDIWLYSSNPVYDNITDQLISTKVNWVSLVGMPDDLALDRIRRDQIDILVDLSGHTAHNRLTLFARKPAPIQITWLGYWATTGLAAMDCILCTAEEIPESETRYFTERPWYLPETRLCFTPPAYALQVDLLPALKQGVITFGCFNNLVKMSDQVVALWAQVLRAIPQSRLYLKAPQLKTLSQIQTTLARFKAHGIESDRLLLEGLSLHQDYLAAYSRVDIALDPFPFTGGTTSCEGLWMGVPFITKRGDSMIARQGEGILRNIGLTEWIAENNEDYLAKAIALSADLPKLATLRAELRNRLLESPVCDARRFAKNLEAAFAGIWSRHSQDS